MLNAQTGADGGFVLSLPTSVNELRIEARTAGYLIGYRGQLGPNDYLASPLDVSKGERVDGIRVRLWPEGVIRGVVRNKDGSVVVGAAVSALTRIYTGSGYRWWRQSVIASTDDRGEYRIDRLPPGEYVLVVRPAVSSAQGVPQIAPAFSPGVSSITSAEVIHVSGSSSVVAITLPPPSMPRAVLGVIVGSTRSAVGMTVRLSAEDSIASQHVDLPTFTTKADAEGRFRFTAVQKGAYRLTVCDFPPSDSSLFKVGGDFQRYITGFLGPLPPGHPVLPPLPPEPTLIADLPVVVDGDRDVSVSLTPQHGARIRGRVLFKGVSERPETAVLTTVPVVVRPADGGGFGNTFDLRSAAIPQGRIEADGTFGSVGLPPGSYVVGLLPGFAALGAWKLSAIESGGQDVLGKPLVLGSSDLTDVMLTLTDKPTVLSGSVVDGSSRPASDVRVIIFPALPADRRHYWASPAPRRTLQAMPDRHSRFKAEVPPGEYLVAAVASDLPASWMSPEYLERLAAGASPIRVGIGEQRTVLVTAQRVSTRQR